MKTKHFSTGAWKKQPRPSSLSCSSGAAHAAHLKPCHLLLKVFCHPFSKWSSACMFLHHDVSTTGFRFDDGRAGPVISHSGHPHVKLDQVFLLLTSLALFFCKKTSQPSPTGIFRDQKFVPFPLQTNIRQVLTTG